MHSVDGVAELVQHAFGTDDRFDLPARKALDSIQGLDVGWIGHGNGKDPPALL